MLSLGRPLPGVPNKLSDANAAIQKYPFCREHRHPLLHTIIITHYNHINSDAPCSIGRENGVEHDGGDHSGAGEAKTRHFTDQEAFALFKTDRMVEN